MSFDWYDYEIIARYLAGAGVDPATIEDEARYRAAISRAYYSAFNTAYEFIDIYLGLVLVGHESTSIHTRVINTYRDDDNPIYIEIGENLNRLRVLRVEADYHNTMPNIDAKTKNALRFVRSIRERIDSLKNT